MTTTQIHPSAVIEPGAQIGRDVEIGAFCVVGGNTVIGDGCRLHHHAIVMGHTHLGAQSEVFPGAIIGCIPQDKKFHGEKTLLEIGERNTFREYVTVHPGTSTGGGITRIGSDNLFLIGSHIAHDCIIGNRCILANYVQLGGHVVLEDSVNFGGHAAAHHFVTVGRLTMIGGLTPVTMDVPPFVIYSAARTNAQGSYARVRFINRVGLQRAGLSTEEVEALVDVYRKLYSRRARLSGKSIHTLVDELLDSKTLDANVRYMCSFLKRTFAHGRNGRYLESLRQDRPGGSKPNPPPASA